MLAAFEAHQAGGQSPVVGGEARDRLGEAGDWSQCLIMHCSQFGDACGVVVLIAVVVGVAVADLPPVAQVFEPNVEVEKLRVRPAQPIDGDTRDLLQPLAMSISSDGRELPQIASRDVATPPGLHHSRQHVLHDRLIDSGNFGYDLDWGVTLDPQCVHHQELGVGVDLDLYLESGVGRFEHVLDGRLLFDGGRRTGGDCGEHVLVHSTHLQ